MKSECSGTVEVFIFIYIFTRYCKYRVQAMVNFIMALLLILMYISECSSTFIHIIFFTSCSDYENCKAVEDDTGDTSAMSDLIHQRLLNTYAVPFNCMSEKFFYFPRVGYEWVQQKWKSLW